MQNSLNLLNQNLPFKSSPGESQVYQNLKNTEIGFHIVGLPLFLSVDLEESLGTLPRFDIFRYIILHKRDFSNAIYLPRTARLSFFAPFAPKHFISRW